MTGHTPRPRAVCILGMHRSGTSVVAKAVGVLGAYLGAAEELLPAAPDNPQGFWERRDVCGLGERLLAALGTTWDTVAPLPEAWLAAPAVGPLREELAALIGGAFAGRPLWAWKDPRTCLLLPLWKEVLRGAGVDLGVLFTVRNPLDVARSLHKRDGLPPARGFGVWFNYNLSAIRAVAELPVAFVSYDRFLEGPRRELLRCASALGLPWPAPAGTVDASLASLARPELRHSASGSEELIAAGAAAPVRELYGLLERLAAGASLADPEVAAPLERLGAEHAAYAALFRDELAAAGASRLAQRAAEAGLRDCTGRLEVALAHAALVERSWSWRVTAPLRRLRDGLRGS